MKIRLLVVFAWCAAGLMAQHSDRRLVVISVDGLMPATLRNAEKAGLHLPNLVEMRDKGAFAEGLVGVFPTVTFPSHTTMMTGRQPSEHGIYSNTLFDPEEKTHGAWFYYSESIKVPTLWQAAHQAGKKVGVVSWPVTVGANIDYNIPEYRPAKNEDLILLQRAISSPGLFAAFEEEHGRLDLSTRQDDGFRAAQAGYILRHGKPELMLIHLIDLDHEQHGFGPGSVEAKHALEGIDRAIGQIRKAVEDAGNGATTRWLIVSDHGFWPVSQAFHPQAFLTSLGLAAPEGHPENWRVVAHSNGGSIAFVSRVPDDHDAQKLVLGALETLAGDPRWGIDQVLSRTQLDEHKSYPLAFAAVSLRRGFTSGSAHSGAWVTPSLDTRGTHGYLPGPAELDTTFLAFGPGVAARRLPRGELADVAPTAAALLGVSLPSAGGRNLLEVK